MESETKTDNQGQSQTEDTSLSGHEEYFQIQYYLLGGKNGLNQVIFILILVHN